MGNFINRTGQRYGRLVVVRRDTSAGPASKGRRVIWVCRCNCGNVVKVTSHSLSCGNTRSCGCLHRDTIGNLNRSHELSYTPTYNSWRAAKDRCFNPAHWKFPEYGGAGITMCDRWVNSFEAFLADMGVRPQGTTLDRIDGNRNYEPGNCRWADTRTQQINRTGVRLHLWQGKMMTSTEVAALENIPASSLRSRLKTGEVIDDAVAYVVSHRR